MLEYRFATPGDMPDLIDCIDLVFSHVGTPHDFEEILPKCYGKGRDFSSVHAIAVGDGRVRGVLGSYPVTQVMAGETLHAGYLGSMAVHRHERGSGVMKKLVQMQLDRAAETGLDMLLLGGQRQRYEYHGFYHCGCHYRYYVSAPTVRHGLRDVEPALDFEKLTEDSAHVSAALEMYNHQPVSGARTMDDFVPACRSYWSEPWIILENGKPVGYLVSSKNGDSVSELVMADDSLLPQAVKSWWVKRGLSKLHIAAAPYCVSLNRFLASFAEGYSTGHDSMMVRLYKPDRVIRAYMKLKNSLEPLADGVLKMKLADHPTLKIQVAGGEVTVEPTDEEADLTLTMEEGVHLLFSHNRFSAPAVSTPAGWFPLPMAVATPDTF
ncbi:MAG: GNAT family N-acetyltransferase [Clostridia bacterium]|nr:GNAT family N-acetyltransferase [Clostridia bacterium]MBR6569705.1 GNAT family N-acetyltransferase [Clostridia bacterium]